MNERPMDEQAADVELAKRDPIISMLREEIIASSSIRMVPEIQPGWTQAHQHILALLDKVEMKADVTDAQ